MASPVASKLLVSGESPGSGTSGSSDGNNSLSDGESGHRGNGVLLTAALIVADVAGAGILSMPLAIAQFGWLLGTVALLVSAAMNVHISLLMWRVKMMHPHVSTYKEFAAASFSTAPEWQKQAAVCVSYVTQQVHIFACMSLWVLTSGKGIGMMFFDQHICLPQWSLVAQVVIIPYLATTRKLDNVSTLVWVNVLTLIASVTIPLGHIIMTSTHPSVEAVRPLDAANFVKGNALFGFAFTGQFMLVEIMSEMEDPAYLPAAYAWFSGPFLAISFLATGLIGYCYIGDGIDGMFAEYLPFGVLFRASAVCLTIHMMTAYIIKSVVVSREIHRHVDGAHMEEASSRSYSVWFIIVVGLAAAAYTTANVVPFFGDLMDLIGSLTCPINCLIMPTLCYLRAYVDGGPGMRSLGSLEKLVIAMELSFSLVLIVYGTYTACLTIRQNWDTYGYPFECHCDGLWNTCDCSSYHLGMEHCSASV